MFASYQKQCALAWLAKQFVGVREESANKGAMVEKFQRAVDGKAVGESWCAGFVQYCVLGIDGLAGELGTSDVSAKKHLVASELVTEMWAKTPLVARRDLPEVGSVVAWAKLVDGKASWSGHTGIVVAIGAEGTVHTVEGNTSSGVSGSQRDGDGVYQRVRVHGEIPGFVRLGYMRPWP